MYFELNHILYYVHYYHKDYYDDAYYIYYKDGELVFIDYNSISLEDSMELFKKIKKI